MSVSLAYSAEVTILNCATCGGPIALTDAQERSRRANRKTFVCAEGHSNFFNGKTADELKAERLEGELAREKQRRQMAEREASHERKRAEKAERKVKRTTKGVCPCCTRSFTNLRRHMETQHPDEVKAP